MLKVSKVTLTQAFSETWMTSFILCSKKKLYMLPAFFVIQPKWKEKLRETWRSIYGQRTVQCSAYTLLSEVCNMARILLKLGIRQGDDILSPTHTQSPDKKTHWACADRLLLLKYFSVKKNIQRQMALLSKRYQFSLQ